MRGAFHTISAGLAGVLLLASGSAAAHEDDDADRRVVRDAIVQIDVLARVRERCGFLQKPTAGSDTLNLGKAGVASFDFTIDCNTPFAIGVSSANGGFKSNQSGPSNGFRTTQNYTVGLSVGTSGQAMAPRECSSDSLQRASAGAARCAFFGDETAAGLSSGGRIAIEEKGRLRVSWPDPDTAGPRLVAGTLTDTITITIGARS